jgi:ubiquinone/menaquinone biosynthesis C-methylase UbiE
MSQPDRYVSLPKIQGAIGQFIGYLLKIFFNLLYNQLAWAYDWVADLVSLRRWRIWVNSVIPYLDCSPILELGHGPGHLQIKLNGLGKSTFGIDVSSKMVRIAGKRLQENNYIPCLVVGGAQELPYPDLTFKRVVATFPSEYINNRETLKEVWRVLDQSGELIILITAWITGENFLEKLTAWLFRVTGQAPDLTQLGTPQQDFFQLGAAHEAGFQVTSHFVDLDSSRVMIIQASKCDPENR